MSPCGVAQVLLAGHRAAAWQLSNTPVAWYRYHPVARCPLKRLACRIGVVGSSTPPGVHPNFHQPCHEDTVPVRALVGRGSCRFWGVASLSLWTWGGALNHPCPIFVSSWVSRPHCCDDGRRLQNRLEVIPPHWGDGRGAGTPMRPSTRPDRPAWCPRQSPPRLTHTHGPPGPLEQRQGG